MIHVIAQDSSVAAGTSERYSYGGPYVDKVMVRHTTTNATNADPNERAEYLFITARITGPSGVKNLMNRIPLAVLAIISDFEQGEAMLASITTGDHCVSLDFGHIALLPGEEFELIVYNDSADAEANAILIDAAVVAASNGPTIIRLYHESMDTQFTLGDVEQIWAYDFSQNTTTKRVTLNSILDQNAEVKVRAGNIQDSFALEFAEMATRLYGSCERAQGKAALVYHSDSQVGIPLTAQYSIVGTATGAFRALCICIDDEEPRQVQKRAAAELSNIRQTLQAVPASKVAGLRQKQLLPS